MMALIQRFHQIDVEDKGSVGKQDVIKAITDAGDATYDEARETLKEVDVDSAGRVELADYVDVSAKERARGQTWQSSTGEGAVQVGE
jgi:plastin-1